MVGPKCPEQFICLAVFGLVQFGLESFEDSPVHYLYLSIQLGLADKCKVVPNVKLDAEVSKDLIIKLPAIIGDDGMGESIPIDNQFLEEFF